MKKYFGEYRMTWRRVVIFALVTAVYTALINQVPFLRDTSFQDIAVMPECWLLFAIFIIVNCGKCVEAMLKCFVFFLISQPLIFLIEVPFSERGWELFGYYPYWFRLTLLTLPGAAAAFLLKRKDWLSVLVLTGASAYLAYTCLYYSHMAAADFPHHLLSAVFCAALAVFLIFVLLDAKKHRAAALAVFAVLTAVSIFVTAPEKSQTLYLEGDEWTYSTTDGDVAEIRLDGAHAELTAKKSGSALVVFTAPDGTERSFYVTVSGGGIYVSEYIE